MTDTPSNTSGESDPTERDTLGWSAFFADQLSDEETALTPLRIAKVNRTRLMAWNAQGPEKLHLPPDTSTTNFAVGDWVLSDPETQTLVRRLDRHSLLKRQIVGGRTAQLIAANIDTLFIVTSCNEDFNVARLERYLALAGEAGTTPVILLTKADQVQDPEAYAAQARALQRDLTVLTLNAKASDATATLAPWCGAGQTVALIGSSGVGKSTLLNTLTASDIQATGAIREDDARGRHTTTARSLHAIIGGGLAIDTPGMRTLHVTDLDVGLETVFAEIAEVTPNCRFRDCTHMHEPGCAVVAALEAGTLDADRVTRWRKLLAENRNTAGPQARQKIIRRKKRKK